MRRLVPALFSIALVLTSITVSHAANPASGSVGRGQRVAYTGAQVAASPSVLTRRMCMEGLTCDTYLLSVDIPANFYAHQDRVLDIQILWKSKSNDLDLYVCKGTQQQDPQCVNGLVGSSIRQGTTSERLSLADPAAGTYRIIAAAAAGTTGYEGIVTFLSPPPLPVVRTKSGAFSWRALPVAGASSFGEPSIDLDHSGRVFVTAPGGAGVQMWRSFNGGLSFDHKEIASDGGGGDSEIEFLSNDTGFTADLRISDSAITRSIDHFQTWTQQGVGIEQDRQWLAHRCDREVFLGYHDFVLEAEMINKSSDAGKTWDKAPVLVSPSNSAPGAQDAKILSDQQANTFSGPVVADQRTHDVYVVFAISSAQGNLSTGIPPYGDPEQIVVGVSHDGAKTFHLRLVKSGGAGTLAGLIFPWLTLDRAGNVYVSWAGRNAAGDPINVFLAHSVDHGEHWSVPLLVNGDRNGHAHIYTTISGGAPGVVDIAWYTASTPDPANTNNDWYVDFAQLKGAQTTRPVISRSRVMQRSIHHGDVCLQGILCLAGGDRSLLDFFQIQIGPDGAADIAFANNATPDGTQRVWFARQVAGPLAGNGLPDSQWCGKPARPT